MPVSRDFVLQFYILTYPSLLVFKPVRITPSVCAFFFFSWTFCPPQGKHWSCDLNHFFSLLFETENFRCLSCEFVPLLEGVRALGFSSPETILELFFSPFVSLSLFNFMLLPKIGDLTRCGLLAWNPLLSPRKNSLRPFPAQMPHLLISWVLFQSFQYLPRPWPSFFPFFFLLPGVRPFDLWRAALSCEITLIYLYLYYTKFVVLSLIFIDPSSSSRPLSHFLICTRYPFLKASSFH